MAHRVSTGIGGSGNSGGFKALQRKIDLSIYAPCFGGFIGINN
jgi:hypothetical protein